MALRNTNTNTPPASHAHAQSTIVCAQGQAIQTRKNLVWCFPGISHATYTHQPLSPHVTMQEDELSGTKDKLHRTGCRARAGTQESSRTPSGCYAPLPTDTPAVPRGKGDTLLSILPAVPAYRSVKLDIGNRESCPVAGKLHQACLTFHCHLQ